MKKTFFIIFGIIVILFIIFMILGRLGILDRLRPGESSQSAEIPENLDFSRHYPEVIKGNWEPSSSDMGKILKNEVKNLKNLGVNTVSIVPEYDFKENGDYQLNGRQEEILDNLYQAKQAGFAVLIAPNFMGATGEDLQSKGITLKQFEEKSQEIALYWADIAEKYQVEFFAPQNEYDNMLASAFFPSDMVGPNHANPEKTAAVARWHQQVLTGIKEKFTGKIMAKLDNVDADLNVSGYDYLGITITPGPVGLDFFQKDLAKEYANTAQAAKISGAQWLVAEAWFPYNDQHNPSFSKTNNEGQSLDDLQDEYYQVSFDEYLKLTGDEKPAGYMFIAYLMAGMEIKDRPAETVVKDNFAKL